MSTDTYISNLTTVLAECDPPKLEAWLGAYPLPAVETGQAVRWLFIPLAKRESVRVTRTEALYFKCLGAPVSPIAGDADHVANTLALTVPAPPSPHVKSWMLALLGHIPVGVTLGIRRDYMRNLGLVYEWESAGNIHAYGHTVSDIAVEHGVGQVDIRSGLAKLQSEYQKWLETQ